MAIARMTVCEWQGARLHKQVVPEPTLEQIEAAIRRLDNGRFNDLYLEPSADDDETWLCVGGGEGRYLLSGATRDRFPTLVDPRRPASPVEKLVVGGQEGSYPGNQIHDRETALQAVRAFWATGGFETADLVWADT